MRLLLAAVVAGETPAFPAFSLVAVMADETSAFPAFSLVAVVADGTSALPVFSPGNAGVPPASPYS